MKLVNHKKAVKLAERFQPLICQKISGNKDYITPFLFMSDRKALKALVEKIYEPVLYYYVQENEEYYFINFLVYHPFDWSECKIKFIRDRDSHQSDSESITLRIHKIYEVIDICTVYHYSHKFAWNIDTFEECTPIVLCEDHSHALSPINSLPKNPKKMIHYYYPGSYKRLEDIGQWDEGKLHIVRRGLRRHGVNWLTEQYDQDLKLKTCREDDEERHDPGDIILNPDKLFRIAERYNR